MSLKKITLVRNGELWEVASEREESGESCAFFSLIEVCNYLLAHEGIEIAYLKPLKRQWLDLEETFK